jgi:uncharacterized protein (AIM24 family)
VSETNLEQFREVTPAGRFTLQNSSLLKVRLENDRVQAKLGSMVAYQGGVRFEHQSGGLGRFFKKAMTGEGVKLMTCEGTGDLFLAQDARKIMILDLNNERMTVNGDSILAFEGDVDWDIRRVEGAGRLAGGLFNVVLEGTGKVALTSHGEPVLLDTSTPTFADPDSAIAWSGGVRTSVRSDVSFKTFMGRGCGETFQIAFGGSRVGPAPIPRRPHGAGTLPRRRKLRRHRPDLRGWRLAADPPTGRRPAFFQPPSQPPGLPTGPARRCFCVSPCPRHAAGSSGWRARAFWLSPPRRRRGPRCGRGPCR